MFPPLTEFLKSPAFSTLDRHLARFVAERDQSESAACAAAIASLQLRRGHVFLDLAREPKWEEPERKPLRQWPDADTWRKLLKDSNAVGVPGAMRPLILTPEGKLYLHRYWCYERSLAQSLLLRNRAALVPIPAPIAGRLELLFAGAPEQCRAARTALERRFCVISGGPGTGKTTTVLKILVLLLEMEPDRKLTIHLAAPTGKAAVRLRDTILNGSAGIDCADSVRERLPEAASTLHRLLGSIPGSASFRHNRENPLSADLIVIDEASMIDLPLMAKLFEALRPDCRVILLGDKDQLASVEAGSVLAGIVETAETTPAETPQSTPSTSTSPTQTTLNLELETFNDAPRPTLNLEPGTLNDAPCHTPVCLLNQNFRFGNESGIFRLCSAIREGDADAALEILRDEKHRDVSWIPLPANEDLKDALRPLVVSSYGKSVSLKNPDEALSVFSKFQILTALRRGPYGKETVNALVEEILFDEGIATGRRPHFPGLPLMVTENDYAVRLFNGDIGILLDDGSGKLFAHFRGDDGVIRRVSPARLPFTEPAFAMTVHKSQGSEFDRVLLVLPQRDNPILTRELVYTAVSRARQQVILWAPPEVLGAAIRRRVDRVSGLADFF